MKKRSQGNPPGRAYAAFFPTQYLGPFVEPGDRVRLNRAVRQTKAGTWGNIARQRGMGRVDVQLDDGQIIQADLNNLWFEKLHKPR